MTTRGAEPAYPHAETGSDEIGAYERTHGGLSKRELAAIKLRLPDSGEPWLDDMIRAARRMDAVERVVAAFAMNKAGLEAIGIVAVANKIEPEAAAVMAAATFADALLAELERSR